MFMPEVLKDHSTGRYSTSKIWLNLTNIAILVIYVMLGYNQYNAQSPDLEGWAFLTLVMAGIVTGNRLANLIIQKKYGAANSVGMEKPGDYNRNFYN